MRRIDPFRPTRSVTYRETWKSVLSPGTALDGRILHGVGNQFRLSLYTLAVEQHILRHELPWDYE